MPVALAPGVSPIPGVSLPPGVSPIPGVGLVSISVAPVTDPDAEAYFTAVTGAGGVINAAGRKAYTDLIRGLKVYGIWAVIDRFFAWNGQDAVAAVRDLKTVAVATPIAAPVHTPKVGYAFNGTTQAINTGFNPATAGGNYVLNAAHVAVWSLTNVASSAQIDAGCNDASAATRLTSRNGSNAVAVRVNAAIGAVGVGSVSSSIGLFITNRSGSGTTDVYVNGVQVGPATGASTAMPSANLWVGANNNNGVIGSPSTRSLALASIGGNITEAMAGPYYNLCNTFVLAMAAS